MSILDVNKLEENAQQFGKQELKRVNNIERVSTRIDKLYKDLDSTVSTMIQIINYGTSITVREFWFRYPNPTVRDKDKLLKFLYECCPAGCIISIRIMETRVDLG